MRHILPRIVTIMLIFSLTTVASAQKESKREKREKEKTSAEQSEPKKERKFHISDYLSVGGYINGQYEYVNQSESDGTITQSSVMQIRRARLDLKGTITPKIEFRLQADFANSPKLIDAFVKLKFCRYANLQVGQFKTPFTLENPYSPLDLEFADNAQVISALAGYNDVSGVSSFSTGREIGAMLYGTLLQFERDGEKYPLLGYSVGVFGGNGINVKKDNMAKDIAGRIEFHPFLKHFVLSGSAYWGRSAMADELDGLRLRCAGGAEYKDENLTVRGEYVWGQTDIAHTDADDILYVQRLNTQGFYVTGGYWFRFGWGTKSTVQQKLRPVLRYDFYQKDLSAENGASHHYSAGIDWWPEKHVQLRLQYTLRQKQRSPYLGHAFLTMLSVKF